MPYLYNIKKGQIENFDPERTSEILTSGDARNYMPLSSYKYTVIDPADGKSEEITGEKVRQKLLSGFTLQDTLESRVQNVVRSENTPMGAFGRKALDQALTLGISEALRKPKNRVEDMYERVYRKEFGAARTAGDVIGFLGPLLAGPAGAATKLAAGKTISKVMAKAPSALAIKGITKLGDVVGKGTAKAAAKVGIKSKAALKGIETAGRLTGWAAGDAALFATKSAVEAGRNADMDRSFSIRAAMSEGVRAAPEIFSTSFLLSGGILTGFKGIGLGYRATKWGVGGGVRVVKDTLQESDFANFIRKQFFNLPNSQKAMQNVKDNLANAHKFFKATMPEAEMKRLWSNLDESSKKTLLSKTSGVADSAFIKKNLGEVIQKSSEKEILNLITSYVKDKFKVLPKTRRESFVAFDGARKDLSVKLGKYRGDLLNKFKDHQIKSDKLKTSFKKDEDLWKNLLESDEVINAKALKSIQKMEKSTIRKLVADVRKGKGEGGEVDDLVKWITSKASSVDEIKSSVDILKTQNWNKVQSLWKANGLPAEVLPQIRKSLETSLRKNKEQFDLILDMFKLNHLANKKTISILDSQSMEDIIKRWSRYKTPHENIHLQNIRSVVSAEFDNLIPSKYYVSAKTATEAIRELKSSISRFKKEGIAKKFVKEIDALERLINKSILSKKPKLSVFDINEIKSNLEELFGSSKIQDLKGVQSLFRRSYGVFSSLEDDLFKKLSSELGETVMKSKGEYSLISTIMNSLDEPVKVMGSGGHLNFRDLVFATGGATAGGFALAAGAPLVALGVAGGAWAAAKYTSSVIARGHYFLRIADKVDNFSNFVNKQKEVFSKFKEVPKLKRFLNVKAPLSEVNINTLTLSHLLLGEAEKDFEKFMARIRSKDRNELITNNDGELGTMISAIGGQEHGMSLNNKMTDMKNAVLNLLPKGVTNPITGKVTYSAFEKNMFFRKIRSFLLPEAFLNDFKTGNLTSTQVQFFGALFPEHLNSLVISAVQGLKEDELSLSLPQRKSLNVLLGLNSLAFLLHNDMLNEEKRRNQMKEQRSSAGGQKFNTYLQPTPAERAKQI